MGHENDSGPVKLYIEGQPVEIGQHIPEITIDYSAGGASTEEAMSKVWADASIAMEVAADGMREFFRAMELSTAIWVARIFEPEMARRYLHAKKKRIRKKYEKRILTWFREVFL